MRKNQLEAVALTGMIEDKRKRSWTGYQPRVEVNENINEILKICQQRNEHLLIANAPESHTALAYI